MSTNLADIYADGIYGNLMYRDVQAPTAAYQQAVLLAQRNRKLREAETGFDRGKASLQSNVAAANIGNSGAAVEGVTNYVTDYANLHDDIQANYEEARQQILLELANNRREAAIRQARAQQTALGAQANDLLGSM